MSSYADVVVARLRELGEDATLTEQEAFDVVKLRSSRASRGKFAKTIRDRLAAHPDIPLLVVDDVYSLSAPGAYVVVPAPAAVEPIQPAVPVPAAPPPSPAGPSALAPAVADPPPPLTIERILSEKTEPELYSPIAASSPPPAAAAAVRLLPVVHPAHVFKIVSWNLGSAASASLNNAKRLVHGVVAAILDEDPDVVALQETVKDMDAFTALFTGYSLVRPQDNPKSDHAFLVRTEWKKLVKCADVRHPLWHTQIAGAGHAGHGTTRDPPALLLFKKNGVECAVVSIHAPPVPRPMQAGPRKGEVDTREHDVFINRVLKRDNSILEYCRSVSIDKMTPVVLAGDWNEQVHCSVTMEKTVLTGAGLQQARWVFTGDDCTWTANSGGYDFFAIARHQQSYWTMAQHEIQQTVKKNTAYSVLGASNHDPIVLTMRSRKMPPFDKAVECDSNGKPLDP